MSKMTKVNGRWEYAANVLAAANDVLYLPRLHQHKPASVGVSPISGGTALVEYTLAKRADVEADPATVTWHEWPAGAVSINTVDILDGPVTALRMTAAADDATWEVLL